MKQRKSILLSPQRRKSSFQTPFLKGMRPSQEKDSINLEKDESFYKIIELLKKPIETRSPDDIQVLMKLTENLQFFQHMSSKHANDVGTHARCCKLFKYRFLPKGTAAIYYGDMPDCFYVILKGSALVLLPKDPEIIYKEKEKLRQKFKKLQKEAEKEKIQELNEIQEVKEENSPLIKITSPSSHFKGPVGNINKNTKTEGSPPNGSTTPVSGKTGWKSIQKITKMMTFLSASSMGAFRQKLDLQTFLITSQMRQDVAALGINIENLSNPRHYFDGQVFRYFVSAKLGVGQSFGELGLLRRKPRAATILCLENTHLGILQKCDYETIYFEIQNQKLKNMIRFFKDSLDPHLTNDTITKFAYLFEKKRIFFGEKIYREGDSADYVYLIKKGEIELTRLKLNKEVDVNASSHYKSKSELRLSKLQFRPNHSNLQTVNEKTAVAILRIGDYFGEEEVISSQKRMYSAVCVSSKAILYSITKQKFFQTLEEFKEIHRIFLNRIQSKKKWHETKLNQVSDTRMMLKTFYEGMAKIRETTNPVKCSTSELKEIISLKTKPLFLQTSMDYSNEPQKQVMKTSQDEEAVKVQVKQYKSKHSPGVLIRGLRTNNPKNLISDYPLSKNFSSLNSINQDTLKSLLTIEDVGQEGIVSQTEKIAQNLRNPGSVKTFDNQKRRLKALFQSRIDLFPFHNKNVSFFEKFKAKLEGDITKNYQEEQEIIMKVEGGIEKKLQRTLIKKEQESLDWTKNSQQEKKLMTRMGSIAHKYHKKTLSCYT